MSYFETNLHTLKRPRLLIRAAVYGASRYRRHRHLRMIAASAAGKTHAAFCAELAAQERELETNRRDGLSDYNCHRHIMVLAAMIAEARVAPRLSLVA